MLPQAVKTPVICLSARRSCVFLASPTDIIIQFGQARQPMPERHELDTIEDVIAATENAAA